MKVLVKRAKTGFASTHLLAGAQHAAAAAFPLASKPFDT